MSHPSWVELDALHLGAADASQLQHVTSCAQCGDYLERLKAPLPPAAWLSSAAVPSPRRLRPMWTALAAAMVVALLLVAIPPVDETRAKSAPAVSVFARHNDRVELWDGRTPFHAGDAIRFEVYGGAMGAVTVLSLNGEPKVLYQGPIRGEPRTLLPLSFTFDAARGPESVAVVLSLEPLDAAGLRQAIANDTRTESVWVTRLTFPKAEQKEDAQ